MRTKEEILETKNWSMEYPNFMQESEILDAMDEYAKEFAIEFYYWMTESTKESMVGCMEAFCKAYGFNEKQ